MDFDNLKIGIWGFGKEGQSLHHYIQNIGGYNTLTILTDDKDLSIEKNICTLSGSEAFNKIQSGYYDIVFTSPGISLYRPEIIQAKENGTTFSSATNLWFKKNTKTKKIVITGTKGKSTSSSLLLHLMKEAGLSVSLAGNIGIPLLDIEEETDYTILELSSYQLAGLKHAPDIFVVLNLFPEHLQWHINHDNYYQDKLSPLKLDGDFTFIANQKDKRIEELTNNMHETVWFNNDDGFQVENEKINSNGLALKIKSQLKGEHNLHNIAAVLTICETIGMDINECISNIKNFGTLPHRLQEFNSRNNFLCVNDSISTTPETTMAAMDVYKDSPLFLIMGGTDRGQDYSTLISSLKNYNIRSISLLPKNGVRLEKEFNAQGVKIDLCKAEDLKQATDMIKKSANTDDVVILSPGAPSHDQFNNFEERGDLFMKLMKE